MSKLSPNIMDSESISLLSIAKIFSVFDFLQADTEKIVLYSKLTAQEVLQLKTCMVQQFSSFPINGLDTFSFFDHKTFIKTHIEGLDEVLSGGLVKGSVLELCGPSGCGKTLLCHSIAVKCALDSSFVMFIDTKGDFSASLGNILLPIGLEDEEMDRVLEQIRVYSTKNIYELISVLNKVHSTLKENFNGKNNIVIIDSITVPYLPFIGVSTSKGFSILNFIASTLKKMAVEYNSVMILTNLGVVYNENEDEHISTNRQDVKPLMGKYWQHIPNTRIIITRDQESNKRRRIVVHKSDYLPVNKTGIINISETGLS